MLYLIGIMIAKLMSAIVFVYTLYFLVFANNRVLLSNTYWNLNVWKRVSLMIFAILAFCIFVGNFL